MIAGLTSNNNAIPPDEERGVLSRAYNYLFRARLPAQVAPQKDPFYIFQTLLITEKKKCLPPEIMRIICRYCHQRPPSIAPRLTQQNTRYMETIYSIRDPSDYQHYLTFYNL